MKTSYSLYNWRILVDAAQTPSIKTKIAELKFVTSLVTTYCRNDDFPKQTATNKAIQKIIQLSNDQKSVELRSQARSCLIALYNCNTPEVNHRILNELSITSSNHIIFGRNVSERQKMVSWIPFNAVISSILENIMYIMYCDTWDFNLRCYIKIHVKDTDIRSGKWEES